MERGVKLCDLKISKKVKSFENYEFDEEFLGRTFLGSENDPRYLESSPLQVSGAVTRLAVYRAAPHYLTEEASPLQVIPRGSITYRENPLLCKLLRRGISR